MLVVGLVEVGADGAAAAAAAAVDDHDYDDYDDYDDDNSFEDCCAGVGCVRSCVATVVLASSSSSWSLVGWARLRLTVSWRPLVLLLEVSKSEGHEEEEEEEQGGGHYLK